MRIDLISLCVVVAIPSLGYSALGYGGEASAELLYRHGSGLSEPYKERSVLSDTFLEVGWKSINNLGWNFSAKGRYRREEYLESEVADESSVQELILDWVDPNWTISMGKQNLFWGKMDIFPLLDVVNPRDTREFILDDEARARIPLWLISTSYYWADQSVQLVLVPDIKTDILPHTGDRFYPIRFDTNPTILTEFLSVQEPENRPANWEIGLKWADVVGPFEISVVAYDGWSNAPVYFTEMTGPTTLRVEPRPVRQKIFGISGDAPVGATVWRFELVHIPVDYASSVNKYGIPVQKQCDTTHEAVGIDWTPDDWLIGGQLFHFDDSDGRENYSTPTGTYGTAVVEKYFLQRRLKFRLFTATGMDRVDRWTSFRLSYHAHGRYTFSIDADWLSGTRDGFFGRFDDQDRVVASVSAQL